MRKPRLTYQGALHYVISKSIENKKIFPDDFCVLKFLNILEQRASSLKIDVFAFYVSDDSFHLLLRNTSGKLSDFMRQLNSLYASHYRKKTKTRGYLFQDRFESFLIQDRKYLKKTLAFFLNIPVREKKSADAFSYRWSSVNFYFNKKQGFLDTGFIENLFETAEDFRLFVRKNIDEKLQRFFLHQGKIIGDENFDFINGIFKKDESVVFRGKDEVISETEKKYGVNLSNVDFKSRKMKRIRSELIMLLKDECGMRYSEINEMQFFKNLKLNSMGQLYKRAKARQS